MMARMSRELKHMLDTATDGAFAVDAAQIIIYWNQAAARILGYAAAEVTGRSCFAVLCGHDDLGHAICKQHCTISAAALGGQAVPGYNLAARTRSGQVRWINISILTLPAAANVPPMVIRLFRDYPLGKVANSPLMMETNNDAASFAITDLYQNL